MADEVNGNACRKPLAVRLVEILGWAYFVLACLLVASADSFFGILQAMAGGVAAIVSLTMTISLRRGRRAWFLWPNSIFFLLVLLAIDVSAFAYSDFSSQFNSMPASLLVFMVSLNLLALAFVVVPVVLLRLPSSERWAAERTGGAGKSRRDVVGCMAVCLVIGALLALLVVALGRQLSLRANSGRLTALGRNLHVMMDQNDKSHESGEAWVDPASCTNSTQFVLKLLEKEPSNEVLRKDPDIWCVAVNPPEDEEFPLILTVNLNPNDLMSRKDGLWRLTCPKMWGGRCFGICEEAAVVVHASGKSRVLLRNKAKSSNLFPKGVPRLGKGTYFLTPTGRVECVTLDFTEGACLCD